MTNNAPANNPLQPDDDDDLVIEESSHSASIPAPSPKPKPVSGGGGGGGGAVVPRSANVEPLEIEEPHAPPSVASVGTRVHSGKPIDIEPAASKSSSTSHAKHLDICPSCGANMPGPNELVCLRCGFDLKTMKMVKTRTGEVEVDEAEASEAAAASGGVLISAAGKGDLWLPGAMAGISTLILIIAFLSGSHGLFRDDQIVNGVVKGGDRFMGLLKFVVLAGMWTGCGVAALAFVAHLLGMKLGDLKLAAVRCVGIVTTMSLVMLLDFTSRPLEWIVEAVGMIGVFSALSLALFNLKPRDLATFAGSALIMFLLMWLGGSVIVWATTSAL